MRMPKKRILFVVNVDWFFLSHRLPIAVESKKRGYEVHVATSLTTGVATLEENGFEVHALHMHRSRKSIRANMLSWLDILRVFWRVKPDLVHLVTIKPVLLGGIAARLLRVKGVVVAVSGLGYVFFNETWKAKAIRALVKRIYYSALNHKNIKVIFQNPYDRDEITQFTPITNFQSVIIKGSGVDLRNFSPNPFESDRPVVIMASRLLRDKGVVEFIAAAKKIRERNVDCEFILAGDTDSDNPSSITQKELLGWKNEGIVNIVGYCDDIAGLFAKCHVVVLPSYREGLPKVLLEAAASGRAVITTNVPGCRDAIIPGKTGVLVEKKNIDGLVAAMMTLIQDRNLCTKMGRAGRVLAEREFNIESVVNRHLEIYEELMASI